MHVAWRSMLSCQSNYSDGDIYIVSSLSLGVDVHIAYDIF